MSCSGLNQATLAFNKRVVQLSIPRQLHAKAQPRMTRNEIRIVFRVICGYSPWQQCAFNLRRHAVNRINRNNRHLSRGAERQPDEIDARYDHFGITAVR